MSRRSPNPGIFNGSYEARAPLSTSGQLLPLNDSGKQSSDRLLRPGTCRKTNSHNSASAVIGGEPIERRLNVGLPPFKYVGRGNSGLTNLTGCLSNSATHSSRRFPAAKPLARMSCEARSLIAGQT